ncbi:uncharacterized protein LOC130641883 isoform X2 [Hydractinia symbiolongicarpus]|uniref:uncharacterized protein LOC130641883 isoform X2 n=1 Tax=Hydractinia symbiolongicarpus TaxID=13093 RepID=UPI00254AC983|nr:uncharacterized protein LOC130641883 isoform X2 [Hydractinia symbiolongicarpus]
MQPITPKEKVLEDGAQTYIRRTITKSVILRSHVTIIQVCAGLQFVAGVFVQTAFISNTILGYITSPFGIVSIATGIIGLVLSFRMHLTCLNTTFMGFSIATAIYALPMIALMLPIGSFFTAVGVAATTVQMLNTATDQTSINTQLPQSYFSISINNSDVEPPPPYVE